MTNDNTKIRNDKGFYYEIWMRTLITNLLMRKNVLTQCMLFYYQTQNLKNRCLTYFKQITDTTILIMKIRVYVDISPYDCRCK